MVKATDEHGAAVAALEAAQAELLESQRLHAERAQEEHAAERVELEAKHTRATDSHRAEAERLISQVRHGKGRSTRPLPTATAGTHQPITRP